MNRGGSYPQPGAHVHDLACGTGLVTFLAEAQVGPTGYVGVDISAGMLGVARGKAQRTGSRVTFYQHDISDLTDLDLNPNPGGEGEGAGQFDLITCAAALVLLPDPLGAIRSWAEVERVYLSPVFQVKEHKVQQAGELFEQAVSSPMFRNFGVGSIRDQAKRLFDETFVEEAGEEGVLVDEAKMYIGLLSSGDTDVIHEFECYV
ncbi:class I SAM-dependent methyltransferase [Aspergillus fischeri NRRL 181]|uniref:Methyltransferase domain-containing protein n=1 Tax=Neosartorya fischeri (strain ATCC 1020 / DSM 3700 / CBS 544.65 / FGSC A1164 / JCM 1740 / NRRL 181 / WB 181) TaxID=331117 RepID=A1DF65_NEOFI|nr:conserved hypothetical protein [Aspergillus fischeri NRRL 181]EAW18022.1 conserved hypothetical protein [Aspergillus fischeri NRRL 181]